MTTTTTTIPRLLADSDRAGMAAWLDNAYEILVLLRDADRHEPALVAALENVHAAMWRVDRRQAPLERWGDACRDMLDAAQAATRHALEAGLADEIVSGHEALVLRDGLRLIGDDYM